MPDFYIHYRKQGSNIFHGLKEFNAKTENQAIETAKEIFVSEWNFTFPHKQDGEDEVKKYEFSRYAP